MKPGLRRISIREGMALFVWVLASCWSLRISLGAASEVVAQLAGRLLASGAG